MQEDPSSNKTLTFEVSTWFQVHRDVDEHCFSLKLAAKAENFEVCCVEYNEHDVYTRKIVEFALALIELATDSTSVPKIEVEDYDPRVLWEGWSPPEIYDVSITHVREGVVRLSLRHQPALCHQRGEETEHVREGVWVDEVRLICFDLLEEDVRRMGFSLLSAVGVGERSVDVKFDLHRAGRLRGR